MSSRYQSQEREALTRNLLDAALTLRRFVTRGATSPDPGPTFRDLYEAAKGRDGDLLAFLDTIKALSEATIPIQARTYRGTGKVTRRI
jgi:hypothetical protein